MRYGEKLKLLRTTKNLTQPQLAEKLGIEQSYLSKLETGKSLPSEDTYLSILSAFDLQTNGMLEDVDETDVLKMKSIPEVSNYIKNKNKAKRRSRLGWLVASTALISAGLCLFIAGYFALLFPERQYNYVSLGIVKDGESKEIFTNFQSFLDVSSNEKIQIQVENIRNRIDEDYLITYDYRGEIFNLNVEGGSRTYRLMTEKQAERIENHVILVLGIFCFISGLFGIYIERRIFAR